MRHIRKSMIWMGAFLFCSGAVFAQKAERKNVREGNKLYSSEKFTESEIAYRKSLDVNPRSVEGYTSRKSSRRQPSNISC